MTSRRVLLGLSLVLAALSGCESGGGSAVDGNLGNGEACEYPAACLPSLECRDGVCRPAALACPAAASCKERVCGPDPVCGLSCGDCKGDENCVEGQCQWSVEVTATLDWIPITGGRFEMGWEGPEYYFAWSVPIHEVEVASFELTRSEVTVAQYRECWFAEDGCSSAPDSREGCTWGKKDADAHPVTCVSWNQAAAFCRWAGGRLPSESEWEYAARSGGQARPYPWGDEEPSCELAVMRDQSGSGCGAQGTAAVCSRSAGRTEQGLCDMAGNVVELVADDHHETYDGNQDGLVDSPEDHPQDGSAWVDDPPSEIKVFRGGGWLCDYPDLHVAVRGSTRADSQRSTLGGFRCAR